MNNAKPLIASHYPSIAEHLLRPLLKLLTVFRELCGGDSTKFLVILFLTLRTTMHRDFAAHSQEDLLGGAAPILPALRTTVRSTAEAIGVPKETVRRKIAELVEAGWLVRRSGKLYFTALAYAELTPVREQIEAMAARYHEVVDALLQDQATA